MQEQYDEVEALDAIVIAIAQEDRDLESHGKFYKHFKPKPRFELAADFSRAETQRYERTSTYLIDKEGVVRQIFPQLIHHRANWNALLREMKQELAK